MIMVTPEEFPEDPGSREPLVYVVGMMYVLVLLQRG